ncbi:MAG TPA: hypothetical protein VJH21_02045 [Candidatus Paceibacterota bacterium]
MQRDKKDTIGRKKLDLTNEIKLFGRSPSDFFVLKKAERLAAALYLVTDLFPSEDPIRLALRSAGLHILSLITHPRGEKGEQKEVPFLIKEAVSEIVSMLNISAIAQNLSTMNHLVLEREYCSLLEFIYEQGGTISQSDVLFGGDFFDVKGELADGDEKGDAILQDGTLNTQGHHNGHSSGSSVLDRYMSTTKGHYRTEYGDNQVSNGFIESKHRHMKRRSIILDMINKRGRVSVKDITHHIKDCSSKTLQRELLTLVADGVLKKEGERRWSTYTRA